MNTDDIFEAIILNDDIEFKKWLKVVGDINILDEDKNNPLQIAISYKKFKMCYELLERNIDVNNQSIKGNTALHLALEYFDLKLVKMILTKGADVNIRNKHGNTPLWTAVFNSRGRYEIVKLILEAGGNPNLKNNYGKSPLDLALQIKDTKLIELLMKSNKFN